MNINYKNLNRWLFWISVGVLIYWTGTILPPKILNIAITILMIMILIVGLYRFIKSVFFTKET